MSKKGLLVERDIDVIEVLTCIRRDRVPAAKGGVY